MSREDVEKINDLINERKEELEFFYEETNNKFSHFISDSSEINEYLLFLLGHDDDGILYMRLMEVDSELNIHNNGLTELICIRWIKSAWFEMLIDRVSVDYIISKYGNNFLTIGSSGNFVPTYSISVNHRNIILQNENIELLHNVDNNMFNYAFCGWYTFQFFKDFTILTMCEQIFIICILYRENGNLNWGAINRKSSKLFHPFHYVSILGISEIENKERRMVKSIIGQSCYRNSTSDRLLVFPIDLPYEKKIELVRQKYDDGTDLQDHFIKYFTPYLFDNIDKDTNIEYTKLFWKKKCIFKNNNILLNGKIYGIVVNIPEMYLKYKSDENHGDVKDKDNQTLFDKKHINRKYMLAGRSGEIFVPLVPVLQNGEIEGFTYPDYVMSYLAEYDIANIEDILPSTIDVCRHEIMVLDLYNFIIAYFLKGYDSLSLIYRYNTGIKYSTTVKYDIYITRNCFSWITSYDRGGKICVLPLITWILYLNAMKYGFGFPTHPKLFFNYDFKIGSYGTITYKNVQTVNPFQFNSTTSEKEFIINLSKRIQSKTFYHGSKNPLALLYVSECSATTEYLKQVKLSIELKLGNNKNENDMHISEDSDDDSSDVSIHDIIKEYDDDIIDDEEGLGTSNIGNDNSSTSSDEETLTNLTLSQRVINVSSQPSSVESNIIEILRSNYPHGIKKDLLIDRLMEQDADVQWIMSSIDDNPLLINEKIKNYFDEQLEKLKDEAKIVIIIDDGNDIIINI